MGDLTDQAAGCFKVVIIAIAILMFLGIGTSYYMGSGNKKSNYEQGVKDALAGKIDSALIKK